MATITVLGERVLLRPIKDDPTTRGGIILVETQPEPVLRGECMSGEHKGKTVIYPVFTFYEIKEGDETYHIIKNEDILAVV